MGIIEYKRYRRGTRLLRAGQVNDRIWFVQSGVLRGYSIVSEGGKEIDISSWFRVEGELAVSIPSFYRQEISPENIEAFEDSEVGSISYREYKGLGMEFKEFDFIRAELLEEYLVEENRQNRAQRKRSAEQRFEWLFDSKPNLIKRIPDKYLASYLGITPETYSKVKNARLSNINGTSVK